jgi:hypothetical protein
MNLQTSPLTTKVLHSFETSLSAVQTTWDHNPDDHNLNNCRKTLKTIEEQTEYELK